jgi:hypothetical protein
VEHTAAVLTRALPHQYRSCTAGGTKHTRCDTGLVGAIVQACMLGCKDYTSRTCHFSFLFFHVAANVLPCDRPWLPDRMFCAEGFVLCCASRTTYCYLKYAYVMRQTATCSAWGLKVVLMASAAAGFPAARCTQATCRSTARLCKPTCRYQVT